MTTFPVVSVISSSGWMRNKATTNHHHHHKPQVKNYTIRFPNWGQTVDVYARFDSDAIESARIVLELPCRALWDGRIVNVQELSK